MDLDRLLNPQQDDKLVIPGSLAGKVHSCADAACATPELHTALRRLADGVCVCGSPYGFDRPLTFVDEPSRRWYHAGCLARINKLTKKEDPTMTMTDTIDAPETDDAPESEAAAVPEPKAKAARTKKAAPAPQADAPKAAPKDDAPAEPDAPAAPKPAAVLMFTADNGNRRDVKASNVLAITKGPKATALVHVRIERTGAVSEIASREAVADLVERLRTLGIEELPGLPDTGTSPGGRGRTPRASADVPATITHPRKPKEAGDAQQGRRARPSLSEDELVAFVTSKLKADPSLNRRQLIMSLRSQGNACSWGQMTAACEKAAVKPAGRMSTPSDAPKPGTRKAAAPAAEKPVKPAASADKPAKPAKAPAKAAAAKQQPGKPVAKDVTPIIKKGKAKASNPAA